MSKQKINNALFFLIFKTGEKGKRSNKQQDKIVFRVNRNWHRKKKQGVVLRQPADGLFLNEKLFLILVVAIDFVIFHILEMRKTSFFCLFLKLSECVCVSSNNVTEILIVPLWTLKTDILQLRILCLKSKIEKDISGNETKQKANITFVPPTIYAPRAGSFNFHFISTSLQSFKEKITQQIYCMLYIDLITTAPK